MKCCKCKKEMTIALKVCEECYDPTKFNHTDKERISVLVQALRLSIRHTENKSGLSDQEFKEYLKTVLKIY